jgi:hypothetical protein
MATEIDGTPWGNCAAHGCPLLGTLCSDRWYCFCHINRPASVNDAITTALNRHRAIVDTTLDIRRMRYSKDWPSVRASISKRLKAADREDMLPRGTDINIVAWLQRLERELIQITSGIGEQQRIATTVATAKVVGPTHAADFLPYADNEPAFD